MQYGSRGFAVELLEFTTFNDVLEFTGGFSDTHKQSTRFFRNTVDELSVLDDAVQEFFLGDG